MLLSLNGWDSAPETSKGLEKDKLSRLWCSLSNFFAVTEPSINSTFFFVFA